MSGVKMVGTLLPRLADGVTSAEQRQSVGGLSCRHQGWSKAALLSSQFGETHTFFTPALLYLYLPLDGRDPYRDFCAAEKVDVEPLWLNFGFPLFDEFPPGVNSELRDASAMMPWQTSLMALPHEIWKRYREWVGRLTILDRSSQKLYRVCYQKLHIMDPIFFLTASVLPDNLPMLPIQAFTFFSDAHRCYFRVRTRTPWRPSPAIFEPQTHLDHQSLREALLVEHDNPYAFIEERYAEATERNPLWERALALKALSDADAKNAVVGQPGQVYDPIEREFRNG